VGAFRGQLAGQFLAESLVLSFMALLVAITLAYVSLPAFNELFDKQLTLQGHAGAIAALGLFVLIIGLLAGGYPALVLSRFDAVGALRQQGGSSAGAGWLRKGLVVVQFAASSALLFGTAVIHSQVHYMQAKDLGFDGSRSSASICTRPTHGIPRKPFASLHSVTRGCSMPPPRRPFLPASG
jgi:putative ABC transport system permease protein